MMLNVSYAQNLFSVEGDNLIMMKQGNQQYYPVVICFILAVLIIGLEIRDAIHDQLIEGDL